MKNSLHSLNFIVPSLVLGVAAVSHLSLAFNLLPKLQKPFTVPTSDIFSTGSTALSSTFLTLWEPAYDIFVLRFWPKNSSFWLPYQRPSSSANCARELFKGSNGSASLVDCTWKTIFWSGVGIFCDWRHKWSSLEVILAHVAWPRAQPLGQSVLLKFLLETRLESESFEPTIGFIAFLVQKWWSKINKLIN